METFTAAVSRFLMYIFLIGEAMSTGFVVMVLYLWMRKIVHSKDIQFLLS